MEDLGEFFKLTARIYIYIYISTYVYIMYIYNIYKRLAFTTSSLLAINLKDFTFVRFTPQILSSADI